MATIKINGMMTAEESGAMAPLQNTVNLTDVDKENLIHMLSGCTHVKRAYITRCGEISYGKFQYKGGFPEFKDKEGKFYSRMKTKIKKQLDQISRTMKNVRLHIPWDEYEIVSEFENPGYKVIKETYIDYEGVFRPYTDPNASEL